MEGGGGRYTIQTCLGSGVCLFYLAWAVRNVYGAGSTTTPCAPPSPQTRFLVVMSGGPVNSLPRIFVDRFEFLRDTEIQFTVFTERNLLVGWHIFFKCCKHWLNFHYGCVDRSFVSVVCISLAATRQTLQSFKLSDTRGQAPPPSDTLVWLRAWLSYRRCSGANFLA